MLCELVATYSDETQNPSRMVAQNVGLARRRADDHHIKSFHRLRGVDNFHTMWFYWSPTSSQRPSTRPRKQVKPPIILKLANHIIAHCRTKLHSAFARPNSPSFPNLPHFTHTATEKQSNTHRNQKSIILSQLHYITLHD